jgi:error-prone DNA polymerase
MIKGMSETAAGAVVRARQAGAFRDHGDFAARTGLSNAVMTRLANADAFGSLGLPRRPALWQSMAETQALPLFANLRDEEPPPALPPLSSPEEVVMDYQSQGLSLRGHPFAELRESLAALNVVPAARLKELDPDRRYRVGGLVLVRQRPSTAKGITFMTLEDETGTTNLIVRPPVWERFRPVARHARALIATGLLQRQEGVIHLIVDHLEDLTDGLPELAHRSRDFH